MRRERISINGTATNFIHVKERTVFVDSIIYTSHTVFHGCRFYNCNIHLYDLCWLKQCHWDKTTRIDIKGSDNWVEEVE